MRERLIRRVVEAGEAEPAIEPAPSHSSQHRLFTPVWRTGIGS
jgi:hypothetical protein